MKKFLLLSIGACIATAGYAQNPEPLEFEHMLFTNISPNGTFVASAAASVDVFNLETGEHNNYSDANLGLGNALANDGTAVGDNGLDIGIILRNGTKINPEAIQSFTFSPIYGITKDATRLVGLVNNYSRGALYLPYYCDIDEDGNVGPINFLPFPEYDPFGLTVQYASAVCISDDGKTIAGMVVDNRGSLSYPIIYKQNGDVDENGVASWNYYLPTESYMKDVPVIDNPYEGEPPYPVFTDYMDEDSKEIYESEYEDWVMGSGNYPDPFDFMTQKQLEEYRKALAEYEAWEEANDEKLEEYLREYYKTVASVPSFTSNSEIAIKGDGTQAAYAQATYADDSGTDDGIIRKIWIFDTTNPTEGIDNEQVQSNFRGLFPHQILPDGTIVGVSPRAGARVVLPASSYIKTPKDKEFVPLYTFLQITNPDYATWLTTIAPETSGILSSSENMSTFAIGMGNENFAVPNNDVMFYSFVLLDVAEYGAVESIISDSDNGLYKVYNLQGVNVMNTENKADLNNLDKGLYIINGKKVVVRK